MHEFRVGQDVEVINYGSATVTCIAHHRFGCCGYVRYRGKVGVTYSDGTKYHCDRDQLRLVGEGSQYVAGEINNSWNPNVYANAHESFTVVALSVNGQSHCISRVKAALTLLELKQRIARKVNETLLTSGRSAKLACCASRLKLFVAEKLLLGDEQTLLQFGIHGPEASITFVQCVSDRCARNLLLRDLLVSIGRGRMHEAQALVNDVIDANGKAHLAHTLKDAYLGGQYEVAGFLLENCPAEVLFQALSMTTRPGYRPYHTIFRWINRESIFQHMTMTHQGHFLEIIDRRLSGRWMSKMQQVEAHFWGELVAEADWVRRRVGDEHLIVWARGRSTNPEHILRQLEESRLPRGISSASSTILDAVEDDFVLGAKEARFAKSRSGIFFHGKKTQSRRRQSCAAQDLTTHRPRHRERLEEYQIRKERWRKCWRYE